MKSELYLVRETLKGKQEIVRYISDSTSDERRDEIIQQTTKRFPKDLILILEFKGVKAAW